MAIDILPGLNVDIAEFVRGKSDYRAVFLVCSLDGGQDLSLKSQDCDGDDGGCIESWARIRSQWVEE